jgi:glycosyltransferase involved in cell wall biosynthesis
MDRSFSIDVVVCTYNNASLLQETLASLEQLDVPAQIKWSVLVVDNNCTDDTRAVVEQFTNRRVLPLTIMVEKTQGLTAARVCGVKHTTAEWIAFIDDDCLLAPDWIEQAATFLRVHPACRLFGGRINLCWDQQPPLYLLYFPFAFAGKNHGDNPHTIKSVAGAGMVVNRIALEGCGWVNEQYLEDRIGTRLVSGGDVEICLRVGTYHEV